MTNIVTSEELRHLAVMMRRLDDGTTDRISRARNSRRKARRSGSPSRISGPSFATGSRGSKPQPIPMPKTLGTMALIQTVMASNSVSQTAMTMGTPTHPVPPLIPMIQIVMMLEKASRPIRPQTVMIWPLLPTQGRVKSLPMEQTKTVMEPRPAMWMPMVTAMQNRQGLRPHRWLSIVQTMVQHR